MENCTDILYFIPEDNERMDPTGQPQDSIQTHYNVFTIPDKQVDEITMKDINAWFPIAGDYHFRFQFIYNKNIVCWLDITNQGCKLPQVDGMIIMKVLRKSWIDTKVPVPEEQKPQQAAPVNPPQAQQESFDLLF